MILATSLGSPHGLLKPATGSQPPRPKGSLNENVDPAQKPDWFRAIPPPGKTPVLLIDGTAVFEPAVICEYLDETLAPQLHPPDAASLSARGDELAARFVQLERALAHGPHFARRTSAWSTRCSHWCFATSTCSR